MSYEVTTPVFEGPFDLLLSLITAEQVDLYEVSITRIVDGYLGELERMETLDLEVATEFALIAATLIELKSRRLLPGRGNVEMDEELALWEERDLLLARLVECKTFKDASEVLSDLVRRASTSVARACGPDERFEELAPDLLAGVTPQDLGASCARALVPRATPRIDLGHVAVETISVTEVVADLRRELQRGGRFTFRAITSHLATRIQVIARFLAVLELYKIGEVELDQADTFGDLHVWWVGPGDGERSADGEERGIVIGEYAG